MPSRLMWLRAAAVAAVAAQVAGQQCYYRNGKDAPPTEKPCSSAEHSACCPDKWECLDNGLCHYPANNLYGRYSCTDQSWSSPACASNMCTYDGLIGGGESITQCSNHDNDWCCNGDATNVNCCQESPSPRPFFALDQGAAFATIGARQASSAPDLASITGLASFGGGGSPAPRTSSSSTTSASRQQSATPNAVSTVSSATPITTVGTTTSSGPAGVVTLIVTSVIAPTASATTNSTGPASNDTASSSGGSNNLGVIIGCAVGIPLALALALAALIFYLRKRRTQTPNPYKQPPELSSDTSPDPPSKSQKLRYSAPTTAEIDGNPLGAPRPISTIKGHAELPTGYAFQPGQAAPYTPDAVGLGGGSGAQRATWGSGPPQYSPGQHQPPFANANVHAQVVELDGTSVSPVIRGVETPQVYRAYRPPGPGGEGEGEKMV